MLWTQVLEFLLDTAAWSPDGTLVAIGSEHVDNSTLGSMQLLDAATGKQQHLFATQHPVDVLTCSADGTALLTAGQDGAVCLLDITTGDPFWPPIVLSERASAVAVDPTGRWAACGLLDTTIRVLRLSVGVEHHHIEQDSGQILGMVVSTDGRWLAVACENGNFQLFDLTSGVLRFRFGLSGEIALGLTEVAMSLSMDGTQVALGAGNSGIVLANP